MKRTIIPILWSGQKKHRFSLTTFSLFVWKKCIADLTSFAQNWWLIFHPFFGENDQTKLILSSGLDQKIQFSHTICVGEMHLASFGLNWWLICHPFFSMRLYNRVTKVVADHGSEFSGNKQDQRTMKTAIKIFLAFPSF